MAATTKGLEAKFATAIQKLLDAAGGKVWLNSAYRSEEEQKRLWDAALKKYGSAAAARKWVAPPGKSNHGKGIAVDLGGDLKLAAKLAGQFGLSRPMSWEPWHFEPLGQSDDHKSEALTTPPMTPGATGAPAKPKTKDYMSIVAEMLGILTDDDIDDAPEGSSPAAIEMPSMGVGGAEAVAETSTVEGLDAFMAAIKKQESGGNYKIVGQPTKWGRATGAYQFLDGTWGRYKGYARAADAPPEVQDEKARDMMSSYFQKYGSWDAVAAAWFSGPGGKWQSPEVKKYVSSVMSKVGGK